MTRVDHGGMSRETFSSPETPTGVRPLRLWESVGPSRNEKK